MSFLSTIRTPLHPPSETPPGLPYSGTLDEAFVACFRGKKWRVDLSGSYTVFDGVESATWDLSGHLDLELSDSLPESRFACSTEMIFSGSGSTGDVDTLAQLQTGSSPTAGYRCIYPVADVFYPMIDIMLELSAPGSTTRIVMTPGGGGVPISCQFLGKTITLYHRPTDLETVTDSTVSLDFTIIEYFEYDPGDDGGPIYNSTTGAMIRDPFSVHTGAI